MPGNENSEKRIPTSKRLHEFCFSKKKPNTPLTLSTPPSSSRPPLTPIPDLDIEHSIKTLHGHLKDISELIRLAAKYDRFNLMLNAMDEVLDKHGGLSEVVSGLEKLERELYQELSRESKLSKKSHSDYKQHQKERRYPKSKIKCDIAYGEVIRLSKNYQKEDNYQKLNQLKADIEHELESAKTHYQANANKAKQMPNLLRQRFNLLESTAFSIAKESKPALIKKIKEQLHMLETGLEQKHLHNPILPNYRIYHKHIEHLNRYFSSQSGIEKAFYSPQSSLEPLSQRSTNNTPSTNISTISVDRHDKKRLANEQGLKTKRTKRLNAARDAHGSAPTLTHYFSATPSHPHTETPRSPGPAIGLL